MTKQSVKTQQQKVIDILTNNVRYFCYSNTYSEAEGVIEPGMKFLVIAFSEQWIKINLNSNYDWMSLRIIDSRFSLPVMSKEEPDHVHFIQPYLFGMDEGTTIEAIHSTIKKVSNVFKTSDQYSDKHKPLPFYIHNAINEFEDLFRGAI